MSRPSAYNEGETLDSPPWEAAPPPLGSDDYGARQSVTEVSLPVVSTASFAGKDISPRPWHVPEMIPGRTVTLLAGDGGVGKSLIAKQLAVATSADADWFGTSPRVGPVVFFSAEDDLDELHRRIAAVADSYRVDLVDLVDLHFIPLAGRDAV